MELIRTVLMENAELLSVVASAKCKELISEASGQYCGPVWTQGVSK
jgi:hypothetical protein